MEGLGNKAANMASKWQIVAVNIGELGVKGAIEALIDGMRGLADIVNAVISNPVGEFFVKLTVAVAGLAIAVRAFNTLNLGATLSSLVTVVTTAVTSVEGLKAAFVGLNLAEGVS